MALTKSETVARTVLHGMFLSDARTSKAVADEQITGEDMKKRQRKYDTNAHSTPVTRQMKHRTENGWTKNDGRVHELYKKHKPKRKAARKHATRRAIMTL